MHNLNTHILDTHGHGHAVPDLGFGTLLSATGGWGGGIPRRN